MSTMLLDARALLLFFNATRVTRGVGLQPETPADQLLITAFLFTSRGMSAFASLYTLCCLYLNPTRNPACHGYLDGRSFETLVCSWRALFCPQ
eukprot:1136430-Pelagomonas_calceolata.AAC.1